MTYDPHQPDPRYQVPAVPSSPPMSPHPCPQPYPPPQQFLITPNVPTSGWATAALVLGILGALGGWCMLGIPCLVAIAAGHIGMSKTRDGRQGGRGLAVAGMILGYVFVVPWIVLFFTAGMGAGLTSGIPTATPTP